MTENSIRQARFLLIDDGVGNLRLLEQMLETWGCSAVYSTTDPRRSVALFEEHRPDIVLLDLMMPECDGFEVMRLLQPLIEPEGYLPILVLTADHSPPTRRKALAAGAKDFVTKPFDMAELSLRIGNLLETRFLHLQLRREKQQVEEKVHQRTRQVAEAEVRLLARTRELQDSQVEILRRLARAAEWRDDETGDHCRNVGRTAALLAERLGLSAEEVHIIAQTAPLHDLGKMGIPDTILLKTGPLTDEERAVAATHPTVGSLLLSGGQSRLVQTAEQIARCHHEHWDGSGYPDGLRGPDIPMAARLVAVADAFDALVHDRPYRKARSIEEGVAEIHRQRGRQFDPDAVAAFMALDHDMLV